MSIRHENRVMLRPSIVLGSLLLIATCCGLAAFRFGLFRGRGHQGALHLSQADLNQLEGKRDNGLTKLPSTARQAVAILRTKCVRCHNPSEHSGSLDLTTHESLVVGGDSGRAFEADKPKASLLTRRIVDTESPMPPEGEGKALIASELQVIQDWLEGGALFPSDHDHWAFQQEPQGAPYPANASIDSLLGKIRAEQGLAAGDVATTADRRKLIQRLFLDLTGLPPSAADLERHFSSKSSRWYSELVDELLASPRYGVRWAQLWLDLARYADSDGFEKDLVRPDAWRYRQWVVDVLNQDLPFDKFSKWQIAGDCSSDPTLSQQLATGFLRCAPANREGGTDPQKNDFERDIDRLNSIGSIWLGISLECAQCHDHPFEPVSQREYFQLLSFVEDCENETIFAPSNGCDSEAELLSEYRAKREAFVQRWNLAELQADWEEKLRYTSCHYGEDNGWDNQWLRLQIYIDNAHAILFCDPSERTILEQDQLLEFFIEESDDAYPRSVHATWELDKALKAFDAMQAEFAFEKSMVTRPSKHRAPTFIRARGDFYQPSVEVQAGFPEAFGGSAPENATREALASWLFEDCQLLTARVAVHRVWRELFGQGFVADGADFGVQSGAPVSQEVLDFVASKWIQHGWSLKDLVRLIVHSKAYQQDSVVAPTLLERDPSNHSFTRQTRIRLGGEQLRDRVLFVGGMLNEVGGRSFFPPQPFGFDKLSFNPTDFWMTSRGEEQYRRSLYIHRQRSALFPFLDLSGSPAGNAPCTFRRVTASPLQSLALLNEELVLKSARALAQQICQEEETLDARLHLMWRSVLSDVPSDQEMQLSRQFLSEQEAAFARDPTSVFQLTHKRGPADLASWTLLARSLMNTDRFQRRE